uniref:Uncharacterized protein n=1 Tax=Arundo donax TaxID=35708 RepID=A0A0A9TCM7_ARUDO
MKTNIKIIFPYLLIRDIICSPLIQLDCIPIIESNKTFTIPHTNKLAFISLS